MSDNLKEQIARVILHRSDWKDPMKGARTAAEEILALEPIAEALKMKPIQTMKVRD